jgi:hypothetical protein
MNYLLSLSAIEVGFWINALSTTAQLYLVIIALRALEQIHQQKKQNELTREKIAIEELRHFEEFIILFEELNIIIKAKNTKKVELTFSEMTNFNLTESATPEFKNKIRNWHTFYSENPDVFLKATSCANKLEVIATALEYGTAKLDVIEDSIALTFCTFVENNAYIYVKFRNDALNLFINTIGMYRKLKPKVKSVNEQTEAINAEVKKILEA